MKIDAHVHITPPEISSNWEKYAQTEPYFSLLSNSRNNKFASAEDVISAMEKQKFDKAVVFGFAFRDIGLCAFVNDYVIEKVKEFSGKLIGFAVAPNDKKAEKEIERCYKAGLKGVGELFPEGQEITLDDTGAGYITDACKEYDLPLLLHANEPVGHSYPGKSNVTLRQLETFAANNPDLKIILAHFGGGLLFYETMKEIKEKFKNVYYDTAASPFLYDAGIFRAVKALGLCEKVLFGSDFPLLPPDRYFCDMEIAGFSEEEKKLILGKNAQR
ncbi:MAG: amidohydrolase family protein [Treponema sp.]|nr:amidohydrolase family protein [Treponema sp.]